MNILSIGKNIVFIAFGVVQSISVQATQLAPPKFNVEDKFGINIPNGQVATRVETVSIGGEAGLKHSISTHTSNFLLRGGFYTTGTNDIYGGNARYEQVADQNTYYVKDALGCVNDCNNGFYVMRVHDHEGSMDFKVKIGTAVIGYASNATSGYTYEAMSDARHTLEIPTDRPGYLVWTKPNGTKVWYMRALAATQASSTGYLEKIIYPNGLVLTFHRDVGNDTVLGVTTNTGFQLKYNYVKDASPNQGIGSNNNNISIPAENTFNWSLNNPKTVVAINNAVEQCENTQDKICVGFRDSCPVLIGGQSCRKLASQWPVGKFNWPVGMPRRFYFGENFFDVINSAGRVTRFRVKAFDTAIDENGNVPTSIPANYNFVPRIVGVTPAGAVAETVTYNYINYFNNDGPGDFWHSFYIVPGEVGYISKAKGVVGEVGYEKSRTGWSPGSNPYAVEARGADGISVVQRRDLLGAYYKISNLDGDIYFEESYRNFPVRRVPKKGPTEDYIYGARGNLIKIIYNNGSSNSSYIEAGFPASCTNPKTCNQAEWIEDAKRNRTTYTYHPESGQVASITYPANKRGYRAQTRFKYEQKYAKYYVAPGNKVQSTDPIWLKTEESYCTDGNTTSDGSCAQNDKVLTAYEYNNDNLLMTGMTVTSQKDGKTLRTCYQYDIYGNRIGETQPKANLSSCN